MKPPSENLASVHLSKNFANTQQSRKAASGSASPPSKPASRTGASSKINLKRGQKKTHGTTEQRSQGMDNLCNCVSRNSVCLLLACAFICQHCSLSYCRRASSPLIHTTDAYVQQAPSECSSRDKPEV